MAYNIMSMVKKISTRAWLSFATIVILGIIIYLSRHEIVQAWYLLGRVDVSIILWLIPLQFLSFYAMGETMFSYLRAQGRVKNIPIFKMARLSLEMNFVNHVLPSAGVSGVSYMGWRLRHYGITPSKSTAAQLARIVATFGAYGVILLIAATIMLFDGELNRLIALVTVGLVAAIFGMIALLIYILERSEHFEGLAAGLTGFANWFVKIITLGRVPKAVKSTEPLVGFFKDLKKDYRQVKSKKKMLTMPLFWGFLFILAEISMFCCAFLALGYNINPAPLVVAYGLASAAGIVMVTPGGAGLYEVIMVAFLVATGVDQQAGIAAIVLARVLLMAATIIAGYAFYQQAIMKRRRKQ